MKGLINLGSTCFISSILQIIFNLKQFKEKFESNSDSEFKTLYHHYHNVNEIMVSPEILKRFIISTHLFQGQQGDQHEFLSGLMNIIHEAHHQKCPVKEMTIFSNSNYEADAFVQKAYTAFHLNGLTIDSDMNLKGKSYGYISPIIEVFTGQLTAGTICVCGAITNTFEIFRSVELSLNEKVTSLTECLDEFTNLEHIEHFSCDTCGKYQNAARRFTFWHLPPVISFTLKRYNHRAQKNNIVLKTPEILDMAPYLTRNTTIGTKYELVAIAHHAGHVNFGHCFSTIKKADGSWRVLNDQQVTILPNRVDNPTDYMYFYSRL